MSAFVNSPGTKFQPFSVAFTTEVNHSPSTNDSWSIHFNNLTRGPGIVIRHHQMSVREFIALNNICNERDFDLTTYLSGRQAPESMKEYDGLDTDVELRVLGKRSSKESSFYDHFILALQVTISTILSRKVDDDYVLRGTNLKEADIKDILQVQTEALGSFVVDMPTLCGMRDYLRAETLVSKMPKDRDCSFLLGDADSHPILQKWVPEVGKRILSNEEAMTYVSYTVLPLYDGSFLDKNSIGDTFATAWVTKNIVQGECTTKNGTETVTPIYYEWAHFDRRHENCTSYRLQAGTTLIVPATAVVSFKGSLRHNVRILGCVLKAWTSLETKAIVLQERMPVLTEKCFVRELFYGGHYPKPKTKDMRKMESSWLENIRMNIGAIPSLKTLDPTCKNRLKNVKILEESAQKGGNNLGAVLRKNPTIVVLQNIAQLQKKGEREPLDGWLFENIPYARIFQCCKLSNAPQDLNLADVDFRLLRTTGINRNTKESFGSGSEDSEKESDDSDSEEGEDDGEDSQETLENQIISRHKEERTPEIEHEPGKLQKNASSAFNSDHIPTRKEHQKDHSTKNSEAQTLSGTRDYHSPLEEKAEKGRHLKGITFQEEDREEKCLPKTEKKILKSKKAVSLKRERSKRSRKDYGQNPEDTPKTAKKPKTLNQ
ncbi:unnamed protein product [Agarophyton chilense]|eukprot:gb/GEZJ01006120.1/.p1 GENE.gb/GEZJ01006120.1/~~gb/GEZJ01006120.1/.p1  ORF type:complete len:659 (-),score=113.81 gb/GEZJ01006120.1/:309-2285(-)